MTGTNLEAIEVIKTPKDHKAEMDDLDLMFPDEMDKLLEQLDGGELSEAEVSRELDKLIAEGEKRRRSSITRNGDPQNQSRHPQIATPTAQMKRCRIVRRIFYCK